MENADKEIEIPSGLFGFEGLTRFILTKAGQEPFLILQSLEQEELSFILIDPLYFRPDYSPDLSEEDLKEIDVKDEENSHVYALAIVTVRPAEDPQMTANLQGPIIINGENFKGKQCISSNPKWQTRHDILAEMKAHQGV
ncbi:MAG: flagellar assembly protein FliW [Spirochaetales bacterium]|nr:flagellar assembly protein FliW [Spirochaetales bacterium]